MEWQRESNPSTTQPEIAPKIGVYTRFQLSWRPLSHSEKGKDGGEEKDGEKREKGAEEKVCDSDSVVSVFSINAPKGSARVLGCRLALYHNYYSELSFTSILFFGEKDTATNNSICSPLILSTRMTSSRKRNYMLVAHVRRYTPYAQKYPLESR